MFLVIQARNDKYPKIGAVYDCDDMSDAIIVATGIVMEQQDTKTREEVREELENDLDFADPDGEWSVSICTSEPS